MTPDEAEARRREIYVELEQVDHKAVRALRENDAAKLAEWNAEVAALRSELNSLEGQ